MKNQKGLLTVVLFSLLFVWQAAAFNIGDRVQANGTVNVRQTAAGTLLGSQSSGSQGAVIGGPEMFSIEMANASRRSSYCLAVIFP